MQPTVAPSQVAQPTGGVTQPTAGVAQPTAGVAQPAQVVAQVVAQPTPVIKAVPMPTGHHLLREEPERVGRLHNLLNLTYER